MILFYFLEFIISACR